MYLKKDSEKKTEEKRVRGEMREKNVNEEKKGREQESERKKKEIEVGRGRSLLEQQYTMFWNI